MKTVTPVEGPWARTWAIAVTIVIVLFASVELGFRARGMSPQFQDTPRLWAYWRAQVDRDPKAVALVGSSRTQLGVDPQLLSTELGGRTVANLALNGSTPLPVLEQLAKDEGFIGTAVVEGYPSALFLHDEARRRNMAGWLSFYEGRSFIDDVEVHLRALVQGSLIVARPAFRPTLFAVTLLIHKRLPAETYTKMHFTRWTAADYAMEHPPNKWTIDPTEMLGNDVLIKRYAHIREVVDTIEKRGGKVVFVRYPTSGRVLEMEQKLLPREEYWDRFVAASGVRAVHFQDDPNMKDLECGDGGHLDKRDVPAHTRAIATIIER